MDEDKNIEDLDSKNQEGHEEEDQEEAQTEEYSEREKGLYARLKKAEATKKELEEALKANEGSKKEEKPKPEDTDINKTVRQILDEEYLSEQDYPDEIKEKAKNIAKIENISIKQALKHDYLKYQIDEYNRKESVANASAGGGNKGSSNYTFDPETPPDVDLSTPEGQEEFEKWEQKVERTRKN